MKEYTYVRSETNKIIKSFCQNEILGLSVQTKKVPKCHDVPTEVCEDVETEDCWTEPEQSCWKEPKEKCWQVSHNIIITSLLIFIIETVQIPDEQCWDEPVEKCWKEPEENCWQVC